jgi:hypothetical protein
VTKPTPTEIGYANDASSHDADNRLAGMLTNEPAAKPAKRTGLASKLVTGLVDLPVRQNG